MRTEQIATSLLEVNNGQIEGLPRNPRKISKKQLEKLKKSLTDAPEMLRLRELICVEHPDGPVVICGNQRLEAAKALGWETLPCKVLPADTDPAKLREYAIKDNLPFGESEFRKFLSLSFKAVRAYLAKGAPFYIWFASCEHINFEEALQENGMKVKQELVWNKNHFTLGRSHYQYKHEPCLYGWVGDSCRYFVDWRDRATVIEDAAQADIDKMKASEMRELLHRIYDNPVPVTVIEEKKPTVNDVHPTMKPVRLFAKLMENSSRPGDIVIDTFGGSGTTMVVAEQMVRKCRMMKLEPHYCDVIIARWEKLTGRKAEKVS